jgi:Domain of unknown function (DUF6259)
VGALIVFAVASHAALSAPPPSPGIAFNDHTADRLLITTSRYRLTLSKRNGKILSLVDRASGARLAMNTNRCLWGVATQIDRSYVGGCSFAPRAARRFSYSWDRAAALLTLTYRGSAVVTVRARQTSFDLRLRVENHGPALTRVEFPEALAGDTATVTAGYAPTVLPGVRLAPAFFSRVGGNVQLYPSRWAFADYLALDAGDAHLSVYSVSRGPIFPVQLGFVHAAAPAPCSGSSFCIVHEFQTWIARGATWMSPAVRVRIGDTAEQSILSYRSDNGIDAYPSLQSKLGARLTTYAEAPLFKANLRLVKPFRDWAAELQRLPSPLLLHPAGFQTGGFDVNDPDFLPPDPRYGTTEEFSAMIAAAHRLGDLVMPYGNLSWWDPSSPTMQAHQTNDVAVLDQSGSPATVSYGDHTGVIVSPYPAVVRQRIDQYMGDWQTLVPADCMFLDQIGARPWLRDFNPASPSPTAYDDGWLAVLSTYSDRCLMVEDGWDRLARNSVGFHGSLLMMSRELDLPNALFGTNWQPYPLAVWLFHDKVLMYQHDLYDGTMAIDGEVLTWNMAFGMISSYSWDALGPAANPWLDLVARLQRDFGPHYVGVRLSGYRNLAQDVNESTYGDLSVIANRDAVHGYSSGGDDVAPGGFLAVAPDLRAGAFEGSFGGVPLSAGVHYVIVERDAATVTVRQPVGADSEIAVDPPAAWSAGHTLTATAMAADGTQLATVGGRRQDGRFVFQYAGNANGRAVAAYRITIGA